MSRTLCRAKAPCILLLATMLLAAMSLAACRPVTAPPPAPAQATAPATAPAAAQAAAPHRILFLGDYFTSQNLGAGSHTAALANSAHPPVPVEVAQVTADTESDLEVLWNTSDAQQQLAAGGWDVVVLEQDLSIVKDPTIFKEYAAKFKQAGDAAGARTVLFMPWESNLKVNPHPIDEIARIYAETGAALGVEVAPVGLAWQRAHQERPALNIYGADSVSPSIYGTYLAACVLYATIFGQDPRGLPYRPADLFPDANAMIKDLVRQWPKLADDDAAFLQRIAWETVQAYKAGQ